MDHEVVGYAKPGGQVRDGADRVAVPTGEAVHEHALDPEGAKHIDQNVAVAHEMEPLQVRHQQLPPGHPEVALHGVACVRHQCQDLRAPSSPRRSRTYRLTPPPQVWVTCSSGCAPTSRASRSYQAGDEPVQQDRQL